MEIFSMTNAEKQKMIEAYVKADRYKVFELFGYDMNEILRQPTAITGEQQQIIEEFDALFSDQIENPMFLYRGTTAKDISPFCSGKLLNYPAFMSASISFGAAIGFLNRVNAGDKKVILKIAIPASQACIYPKDFNGEKEVILPRNLSFESQDWILEDHEELQLNTAPFAIESCLMLTTKRNVT
jgi:hypothetical protein